MAKPSPKYSGDLIFTSLGTVIREKRLEMNLSLEALAIEAELDRSYMGGIERGEHNLTLINLLKIANALEAKPSDLLKSSNF
jgi:transcriptional regulator with XRE-family HTH domain